MLRTMSDDAGSFEFFVPHRSNYRIGVELGSAHWCHVWHADEAVANAGEDAALVWVGLRSITKIEIAIPADKCAYRMEGDVTGTDGHPLGGILVQAIADDDDELTWITAYTAADGTFALEVPAPGDYRVSVELNSCRAFYQHGGIVLEEDRASLVSIAESNASGIRIQLSEGICELPLSGVLFDAAGVPLDDVNVVAYSGQDFLSIWTEADGTFTITVPRAGEYRLQVKVDSCHVFYRPTAITTRIRDAHQISISSRDVRDLRFQLLEGMCEHTISGMLLDAAGEVVPNAWIVAFSDDAEAADYTGSDGCFRLRRPTDGSYRLLPYVEGCEIYRRSVGSTTKWEEASTLRISGNDLTDVTFRLPTDPSQLCG